MNVLVTGAAGLVGQNLIPSLKAGGVKIVAVDKHPTNTKILASLHPDVEVIEADLAEPGAWERAAGECDALIQLHAQIGGLDEDAFTRNNIVATRNVLAACEAGRCAHIVHASSSVINSAVVDFYTESKKAQEQLVTASPIASAILRPTLMFGWFDRKHLGWLRRFMARAPLFPVPGHGRYPRQPLFAGDFSAIVRACLERRLTGVHDISGREVIDYIDLIRMIKEVAGLRTPIVKVPYRAFWLALKTYAVIDRDPPFTTKQLEALITPDMFPKTDWPSTFGVPATPLRKALELTFQDERYADVVLAY